MTREDVTLLGGSRRAVERRVFGSNLRVQLDRDADATTRRIFRAYSKAWQSMQRVVGEMSETAARAQSDSILATPREIARVERVDRAQFALERQIRELSKFTSITVSGAATTGIGRVAANVLDETSDLFGLDRRFTRPSGAAMEGLILRSTQRIESSTNALSARGAMAMKEALFRGLVLGENPTETAREIRRQTEGEFFGQASRAATIARTEIADAHRYATRLAYNESEFVVGWKWLAQLSARTCPACWAMHGTFHEKTEIQYAHPNCRCTQVPVLEDDLPADHDLGDAEEIFWGLPREDQLAIMGPGRLKALEGGALWTDLTYLKHNPEWRPAQQVTSVADLQGLAELNIATTPGDVITVPGFTNASIMAAAFTQGGLTVHALTGEQPTGGYVVARDANSLVIDAREFFGPAGPNAVAGYLTQHGDKLDAPGAHLGMWYDTANGKVVLDIVEILDDREAAIALGRAENQVAIFDLNTFTEIPTGGDGGYLSTPLTAAEARVLKAGDTIVVVQDGVEKVVTVTSPGGRGATTGTTADGETVYAWPDQIMRVGVDGQSALDRVRQLRELSERVAENTGMHQVNFAGMDPRDATVAADTIEKVMADWPEIDPLSLTVGGVDGAFAVTNTSFRPDFFTASLAAESTITLSEDYAADPGKWGLDMMDAEARGHFHRGTSDEPVEFTVDHEFGHVVDFDLFGAPQTQEGLDKRFEVVAETFNALNAEAIEAGRMEPKTLKGVKEQGGFGSGPGEQLFFIQAQQDLSGYGTSSLHEMFAEAFAVYRDHGPGESIVADSIMRGMARRYREKYGRWPNERDLEVLLGEEYDQ